MRTSAHIGILLLLLTHALCFSSLGSMALVQEDEELAEAKEGISLLLTYEPKKVFIAPSTNGEGESIMFNLELRNPEPFKITIKKFLIRFCAEEKLLAEEEQKESFFRHGLIRRKKKILPQSSIKWSGVCLSAESFASIDTVQLVFHLKGKRSYKSIETLDIPVSRYFQKTTLALPFKGLWKVTQGHTCRSNHRLSGYAGDFAWDFAALGKNWGAYNPEYSFSKDNRNVYGFGKDVLAPASGKVVKVVRDVPDNIGGEAYPRKSIAEEAKNPLWAFGNFVIIDHKNGEYSLLGHMQEKSILVKEGEEVQTGQKIAKVGNSGNTKVPHLHYQLMDGDWPIKYEVNGLPALLSNYYILMQFPGDLTKTLDEEHLRLKMIKVLNGDPANNSIIYSPD